MGQRKQDAMTSALLRSIMQEQMNEELLLEVRVPPRNLNDNSLNHLANRINEDIRIQGSTNDPARKILSELGVRKIQPLERKVTTSQSKPTLKVRKTKKIKARKIPILKQKSRTTEKMPMLVERKNRTNNKVQSFESGDFSL